MITMTDLSDSWRQHLRLMLLRLLAETPGYAANECLLADAVRSLGVAATGDQVRGELAWLAEAGLVTVERIAGLAIATGTARGEEVARGLAVHPGVRRPAPRGLGRGE
ncbi:MAG TPA: ArsR family transcriptional regulator [Azospirillaceae bacterium]|nr:ArsR family transcriptional regulator [Azospirillaceae bacterium]